MIQHVNYAKSALPMQEGNLLFDLERDGASCQYRRSSSCMTDVIFTPAEFVPKR